MKLIKKENILQTSVAGLIISIISGYLFLLKIINLWMLAIIVIIFTGSALRSIYLSIENELDTINLEIKKLNEKLIIYERLSKIEKEVFNDKKK